MEKNQRMQRVRVGLTGLAAVLIVVAAAAAVFESASDEPAANALNSSETATVIENMLGPEEETPNEPLAEIGVAPASGPTEAEKQADVDKAKQGAKGS